MTFDPLTVECDWDNGEDIAHAVAKAARKAALEEVQAAIAWRANDLAGALNRVRALIERGEGEGEGAACAVGKPEVHAGEALPLHAPSVTTGSPGEPGLGAAPSPPALGRAGAVSAVR